MSHIMQIGSILHFIDGSMSKADTESTEFYIAYLEETLQRDLPEPRKENTRALIAFLREHGCPTVDYFAWANWGRAGTMHTWDYSVIMS